MNFFDHGCILKIHIYINIDIYSYGTNVVRKKFEMISCTGKNKYFYKPLSISINLKNNIKKTLEKILWKKKGK